MTRRIIPALLLLVPALSSLAADDPPRAIPDKAATRKKIDDLIGKFKSDKSKATLGMLEETMELSISYGAPAWNEKDHEECCNFYIQTAKSLVAAFPDDASATPQAAAAIADLKTALVRANASKDVEENAWSMRYAFDKTQLACEIESSRGQALLALGSDYLERNDFADAQDAFSTSEELLAEMRGRDPKSIPGGWRVAPIASANALIGQKKYHEAVAEIAKGVELVPEWPLSKMDLRTVYRDPAFVDVLMSDLKAELRKSPDDAQLQFLMGYEYFYTGDKEAAKPFFEKALQLDPKNILPKTFLNPPSPPAGQEPKDTSFRL